MPKSATTTKATLARAEELIGRAAEAGAQAVKFQTIVPERLVGPDQTRASPTCAASRCPRPSRALARARSRRHVPVDAIRCRRVALARSAGAGVEDRLQRQQLRGVAARIAADRQARPAVDRHDRSCRTLAPRRIQSGRPGARRLARRPASSSCTACPPIRRRWRRPTCAPSRLSPASASPSAIPTTRSASTPPPSLGRARRAGDRKAFHPRHNHSEFRDHKLSADPAELKSLVERIRRGQRPAGRGVKRIVAAKRRPRSRRGARCGAARDLPAGHRHYRGDLSDGCARRRAAAWPGRRSLSAALPAACRRRRPSNFPDAMCWYRLS